MSLEHVSLDRSQELIAQGATLVDIREPDECSEHIDGADFVPLSEIKQGGIKLENGMDTILFYCRSGRRSTLFADALLKVAANANSVYAVEGGFNAWKDHGLPSIRA